MKVIIFGGGVIGVISAYYLLKKGASVTLLESSSDVATKASGSNAAQLSYTYINPIGNPDIFRLIPKLILGKNENFKIKRFDPMFLAWASKLLMQSTKSQFERNRQTLLALSLRSQSLLVEMAKEMNLNFGYKKPGKLHIFEKRRSFHQLKDFSDQLKEYSIYQKIMNEKECRDFSPRFCKTIQSIAGGIFSDVDAIGECHQFTKQLLINLENNFSNFRIVFDAHVKKIVREKRVIEAVETTDGKTYQGDKFLITAGAYTNKILRPINLSLPIYPIKGYSVTVPAEKPNDYIPCSITDHSAKMVYVPLEKSIRISGLFRFNKFDEGLTIKTVEYIKKLARQRFPDLAFNKATVKTGLRPTTPSCVPYIQRMKYENLYINAGHGMLGWTLAHASGERIAETILHQP